MFNRLSGEQREIPGAGEAEAVTRHLRDCFAEHPLVLLFASHPGSQTPLPQQRPSRISREFVEQHLGFPVLSARRLAVLPLQRVTIFKRSRLRIAFLTHATR